MGWHGALRWLPLAAFNRSNTEGILSDRFAFMFCDARALWFPLPREDHAARVKDGRFVSLPLRRTRILGKDTYGFQSDDRDLLGRVWSGATSPSQGLIKLAGPDQQTIEARGTVLFQDREGSFWLGTEGLGLYRFRKREIETLSVAEGLAPPMSIRSTRVPTAPFGSVPGPADFAATKAAKSPPSPPRTVGV